MLDVPGFLWSQPLNTGDLYSPWSLSFRSVLLAFVARTFVWCGVRIRECKRATCHVVEGAWSVWDCTPEADFGVTRLPEAMQGTALPDDAWPASCSVRVVAVAEEACDGAPRLSEVTP